MRIQSNTGLYDEGTAIEEKLRPKSPPMAFGIWAAEVKVRESLKSWMIHVYEHNITSVQTLTGC